jgi:acyl-CoA dehydrogenase
MKNPFDTDDRRAFREMLTDFVSSKITPHVDAWDEVGEVPWALHTQLGALGVWGFGIDERYGGLGFDDAFMRATYSEVFGRTGRAVSGPPSMAEWSPSSRFNGSLPSESVSGRSAGEARVERIYREVKVMAIGGGSEQTIRDLAVRQMGL